MHNRDRERSSANEATPPPPRGRGSLSAALGLLDCAGDLAFVTPPGIPTPGAHKAARAGFHPELV